MLIGGWVGGSKQTTTTKKTVPVTKKVKKPEVWMDSLAQPKHQKMDMRFEMLRAAIRQVH
jgi:hypothetical protein